MRLDGPGDVLHFALAHILEGKSQLVAHLVPYDAAHPDAARLSERFETSRDIDAITVNVAALDDHVADVDADAELDALTLRDICVPRGHPSLDLNGAGDGIDDARELDECAIAHQLDDPPAARCDRGVDEVPAVGLEALERADLVLAHEARVAHHIGSEDRGKLTFHSLSNGSCRRVLPSRLYTTRAA
ncbi:MAG: hypothetical protein U1F33_13870 [Alphaproteobacteria bacterium]